MGKKKAGNQSEHAGGAEAGSEHAQDDGWQNIRAHDTRVLGPLRIVADGYLGTDRCLEKVRGARRTLDPHYLARCGRELEDGVMDSGVVGIDIPRSFQ